MTNGATLLGSRSQMATPITFTFLSAYLAWMSLMCGIARMHGPHQVAQKSTTVTWPLPSWATGSPLIHSPIASAGAGSPRPSLASWAKAGAPAASARVRVRRVCFMF